MNSSVRRRARASLAFLAGLVACLGAPAASAGAHISVEVADPSAFRDYFWLDRGFGGLLFDFVELADGTYRIEVFGPPGSERFPLEGMFYALTIDVAVDAAQPEVRSVSFDSYCSDGGVQNRVKEWPAPVIVPDEQHPGAFRLVIQSPVVIARDAPCTPLRRPNMAPWRQLGVLKLTATSDPPGAEIWIDGKHFSEKTNATINVPYRDPTSEIDVVIRMPGYVNCRWKLPAPFGNDARLDCLRKTP